MIANMKTNMINRDFGSIKTQIRKLNRTKCGSKSKKKQIKLRIMCNS